MTDAPEKPFAPACERNQEPIREVLAEVLTQPAKVLELGSGTGQHAVYMARHLPHLEWQPTDIAENLDGIRQWRREAKLRNVRDPLEVDALDAGVRLGETFDAVFTANTVHFVSWRIVNGLLAISAAHLRQGGDLLIYGPFNEDGGYTSEGNAELDAWLQERDPASGIKDRAVFNALAADYGFEAVERFRMPANNQLLRFVRGGA
ncbi:methylase [Halovibrio salipaludis]|uniref:Methylase n=1 Tax=Halovibrio salipaludis TaxID=2032626 RepID=A0A2A2F3W5_9GAMM|nr:DUF938 domain-containing protein [Halovibrio salipaludis]PAU80126.1 methylase [Halovibrio salipaludis]